MHRNTARRGSRKLGHSPFGSRPVTIKANGEYRYHFNDLPAAFRNTSNSAMLVVPASHRPQKSLREKKYWSVIINKNSLSNARLSHWNWIHQAMLALVESSYRRSLESRESRNLSNALQAYLHNPVLQRWHEQKDRIVDRILCAWCAVSTLSLIVTFALTLLSPEIGIVPLLCALVSVALIWGGIRLITGTIVYCTPIILKKLSDYPQQNHRQLINNLRSALNVLSDALANEQQATSLARSPHSPPSSTDAKMMSSQPTIPSREARLGMVEIETRPYTSSTRPSHSTPFLEVPATLLDTPPQTSCCVIIHLPESGVSEASMVAPTMPRHHHLPFGTTTHRFFTTSTRPAELIGIEPYRTQSLPTVQADPGRDLRVYRATSCSR